MSNVEGNTNIFYDVDDIGQWRVTNPKKLTKEQAKQLQRALDVNDDGIVGKDTITALQHRLGVDADGKWGKKSTRAWIDEYNDEVNEREMHNIAKSKGKVNPAVVDIFAQEESSKPVQEDDTPEAEQSTELPNIEVDNVELAYLNKEIDKVKNQLAQRQSNYESVPFPKTQVGWASYIANNDSSLLNKYQDAERAWYNKMKDQEHAKALAKAQMEQQAAYRMDDNIKNRSLALNKLQYAEAALRNDTSNDPLIRAGLERDLRNAKEDVKYWNKALGIEEDVNPKEITPKEESKGQESNTPVEVTPTPTQSQPTTKVKTKDYSAIKKFKNQAEKDKILKEIESNPAFNNDEALRGVYNTLKDIVPEDKKASDKEARREKWKAGKGLSGFELREWADVPENKALLKEFGPIGKYNGD